MNQKGMFERRQFVELLSKEFHHHSVSTLLIACLVAWNYLVFPMMFLIFGLLAGTSPQMGAVLVGFWCAYAICTYIGIGTLAIVDYRRTRLCVNLVLRKSPRIRHGLRDSRGEMWADADEDWGAIVPKNTQTPEKLRRVK